MAFVIFRPTLVHFNRVPVVSIRQNLQVLGCRTIFSWRDVIPSKSTPPRLLTSKDDFVERYIPMTRRSLIRQLIQQKELFTIEEKAEFEKFSSSLDSAIIHRYHVLLQELKSLFDPINPDKDTLVTRELNRRERLDHEFWVLQKLNAVMMKANFHRLPDSQINESFKEHESRAGVRVSVDRDAYDVCQFWALGRETPPQNLTTWTRLKLRLQRKPVPTPPSYYKRVVVAMRLKRDDKLCLKAFKEVPVASLEQLMPDGHITMNRMDRGIMATAGTIACASILAKVITLLASLHVDWTLIVTAVSSAVAVQAWGSYKAHHLAYLNDLTRVLYFKNIANNRSVLTTMLDRAEDELFKEALLVYSFLLTNRPPSALNSEGSKVTEGSEPSEGGEVVGGTGLGGVDTETTPADDSKDYGLMTTHQLESAIQSWVLTHTGSTLHFNSHDACLLLTELGLVSQDLEGNLGALSLPAAIRNLPIHPQSLIARQHEHDLVEGYDRHVLDETEKEYKVEDYKRKKYGWF